MKKFKIMIRLIVVNFDEQLCQLLLKKIQDMVYLHDKDITITFSEAEPYWKFPEETQCYFEVSTTEKIAVSDFIKYFGIKFGYLTNTELSEKAIWSQLNSEDILLHKNVTWASIYRYDW